jgi:hypothetical protein
MIRPLAPVEGVEPLGNGFGDHLIVHNHLNPLTDMAVPVGLEPTTT